MLLHLAGGTCGSLQPTSCSSAGWYCMDITLFNLLAGMEVGLHGCIALW
jgi:hypothetical protein